MNQKLRVSQFIKLKNMAKLSQTDLAKALETSQSNIYRMLNKPIDSKISEKMTLRIKKAYPDYYKIVTGQMTLEELNNSTIVLKSSNISNYSLEEILQEITRRGYKVTLKI